MIFPPKIALKGRNFREKSAQISDWSLFICQQVEPVEPLPLDWSRSILCFILFYSIWQRDNSLNQWVLQAHVLCGFVSKVQLIMVEVTFLQFLTRMAPNLSRNRKIISPHTFPQFLWFCGSSYSMPISIFNLKINWISWI